ncbi:MAG: hypothetical protein U9R60_11870 [Bacteroidota bacterium]|nr:hypothetical protein [Bacteroidota bacterium]
MVGGVAYALVAWQSEQFKPGILTDHCFQKDFGLKSIRPVVHQAQFPEWISLGLNGQNAFE